jgi:hypothetical protein
MVHATAAGWDRAKSMPGCLLLTFSFSAEFMAVMVVSGSKSRLAIASKHFLRCGCTARGFLVWLRICSSSSLDRKKNLCSNSRQRTQACKSWTTGVNKCAWHHLANTSAAESMLHGTMHCQEAEAVAGSLLEALPGESQALCFQVVCQALLHTVQQLVALNQLV